MEDIIIKNATIINENDRIVGDLAIKNQRITQYGGIVGLNARKEINGEGLWLIPGIIDDQVHFREPGLTSKATIDSESKAALAGGVTSFMEMPNTKPPALTQKLLEDKYSIAAQNAWTNYSFYMGASNDNLEEVLRTNAGNVCGVKIFMGSSTGNMLVDNRLTLENLFSQVPMLIATHCEDEETIRRNSEIFREKYGEEIPIIYHPEIRSEEACYKSSSYAVELAKKYGSRLHVLHISTARELKLFEDEPPGSKKITSEACIHHLWFDRNDYSEKGTLIKWNPAVKDPKDKAGLLEALLTDKIDVIATDHAPHTLAEKDNSYFKAPSGGPLVQHSLVAMLEYYRSGRFEITRIVEKMCHNPALIFNIEKRGFIREGYWADLVVVDTNDPWIVSRENILSKCRWSPFEGQVFHSKIVQTVVSGHLAYDRGAFNENVKGKRLLFDR